MPRECISTTETSENINIDGIELLQREDGFYAVPGGGFIKDRGHAEAAARALVKSNTTLRTEKKMKVIRKKYAGNDGADLVLGV